MPSSPINVIAVSCLQLRSLSSFYAVTVVFALYETGSNEGEISSSIWGPSLSPSVCVGVRATERERENLSSHIDEEARF